MNAVRFLACCLLSDKSAVEISRIIRYFAWHYLLALLPSLLQVIVPQRRVGRFVALFLSLPLPSPPNRRSVLRLFPSFLSVPPTYSLTRSNHFLLGFPSLFYPQVPPCMFHLVEDLKLEFCKSESIDNINIWLRGRHGSVFPLCLTTPWNSYALLKY